MAEALAAYGGPTDDVLVATKGGHRRPGDGSWTVHGDPAYVKEACEASLKRLGVEAIGLYQYHRPDPSVPWAESVGALADLLDEGKILMAGVSNANVAQIDEAQQVLGGRLVSVQNEFSPRFRSSERELRHCEQLGIAFIPWSPLGGIGRADNIERSHPAFAEVAAEVGASPQQVTLAWMLAKGSRVDPDPGQQPPRDRHRLGGSGGHLVDARAGRPTRRLLSLAGPSARAGPEQKHDPPCCTAVASATRRRRTVRPGRREKSAPEREAAMPAVTVPDNLVLPRDRGAGHGRHPAR